MTEQDLPFDKREIPELNQEQKKVMAKRLGTTKQKIDYGNKYQKNRNMISVVDTLFGQLEAIQIQKSFKTKGELLQYFVELDETFSPKLETIFKCKKCNQQVDAHKDINIDRLVHKDLCKSSQCNGSIITKQKIVKEVLPGTTETKTEQTEQPKQKEIESTREMIESTHEIIPYSD